MGSGLSMRDLEPDLREQMLTAFIDCPEGSVGETITFRTARTLLNELDPVSDAARDLQSYDPATSVCFVGQIPTADDRNKLTAVHVTALHSVSLSACAEAFSASIAELECRATASKKLGNDALQSRNIASARQHYNEALETLAGTPGLRELRRQLEQNLTLCALKDCAWDECQSRCRRLIQNGNADSAKLQYRFGLALSKLGRDSEALEPLARAAELEPRDVATVQLHELVCERIRTCTDGVAKAEATAEECKLAGKLLPFVEHRYPNVPELHSEAALARVLVALRVHLALFCLNLRGTKCSDKEFAARAVSSIEQESPTTFGFRSASTAWSMIFFLLNASKPLTTILSSLGERRDASIFESQVETMALATVGRAGA